MLKKLRLSNFTVFNDETFEFAKNLNVIIGENGLGKSHILKAAYTGLAVSARGEKASTSVTPTKAYFQKEIALKLIGVFKPDNLGRLARRQASRVRCEMSYNFLDKDKDFSLSFHSASKSEVVIENTPKKWESQRSVFLPTRELLTIYPGFVSLYESTHNNFEETWRDTCVLLGSLLAKGPKETRIKKVLEPIETAMGGKVSLDQSGKFYLTTEIGKIEIYLVAEGLRKLAMLARLVATGALLENGYLFWDEPEANLNPAIIKQIAATIVQIAESGIQVFIATHSLFLLREIHILQIQKSTAIKTRYFGLHDEGGAAKVTQSDNLDAIGSIRALDEDLIQSERYLDADMAKQTQIPFDESKATE